jgi:hypothetical protein
MRDPARGVDRHETMIAAREALGDCGRAERRSSIEDQIGVRRPRQSHPAAELWARRGVRIDREIAHEKADGSRVEEVHVHFVDGAIEQVVRASFAQHRTARPARRADCREKISF